MTTLSHWRRNQRYEGMKRRGSRNTRVCGQSGRPRRCRVTPSIHVCRRRHTSTPRLTRRRVRIAPTRDRRRRHPCTRERLKTRRAIGFPVAGARRSSVADIPSIGWGVGDRRSAIVDRARSWELARDGVVLRRHERRAREFDGSWIERCGRESMV